MALGGGGLGLTCSRVGLPRGCGMGGGSATPRGGFGFDERCLGGRDAVEDELWNMHRRIQGARAAVVSRREGPLPRRPQSARAGGRAGGGGAGGGAGEAEALREVHETFRRVDAVARRKGGHLTAPPATLGLSERLSHNRAVRRATQDHTSARHALELQHLSRKVECLARPKTAGPTRGSDRPAMLRRQPLRPRVEMRDVLGVPEPKPKASKALKVKAGKPLLGKAREAPGAPTGQEDSAAPPAAAPAQELDLTTLSAGSSREEEYRTLKAALMAEIVAGRMYEEDRLAALFRRYLRNNSASAQDVLQDVIRDLQVELDVGQA